MKKHRYIRIKLSQFELRLLVNALNHFRNTVIHNGKPAEDIDRLLLKLIG